MKIVLLVAFFSIQSHALVGHFTTKCHSIRSQVDQVRVFITDGKSFEHQRIFYQSSNGTCQKIRMVATKSGVIEETGMLGDIKHIQFTLQESPIKWMDAQEVDQMNRRSLCCLSKEVLESKHGHGICSHKFKVNKFYDYYTLKCQEVRFDYPGDVVYSIYKLKGNELLLGDYEPGLENTYSGLNGPESRHRKLYPMVYSKALNE